MESKELSYWNKYYTKSGLTKRPSSFARFCLDYGLLENKPLLDLGCGNGRDSQYFARQGLQVYACDYSNYIQTLISNNLLTNLTYLLIDIRQFDECYDELPYFGTIYARFLLECLNEDNSIKLLNWCYKSLADGGLICIEVKSIHDKGYGIGDKLDNDPDAFITNGRYRRYIRKDELIKTLEDTGFHIIYCYEDHNLAIFHNSNPVVIRIIAQRPY